MSRLTASEGLLGMASKSGYHVQARRGEIGTVRPCGTVFAAVVKKR
jgi:hypothetical protein